MQHIVGEHNQLEGGSRLAGDIRRRGHDNSLVSDLLHHSADKIHQEFGLLVIHIRLFYGIGILNRTHEVFLFGDVVKFPGKDSFARAVHEVTASMAHCWGSAKAARFPRIRALLAGPRLQNGSVVAWRAPVEYHPGFDPRWRQTPLAFILPINETYSMILDLW